MDLVNHLSQKHVKLGMVVDLTNTDRYYNHKVCRSKNDFSFYFSYILFIHLIQQLYGRKNNLKVIAMEFRLKNLVSQTCLVVRHHDFYQNSNRFIDHINYCSRSSLTKAYLITRSNVLEQKFQMKMW